MVTSVSESRSPRKSKLLSRVPSSLPSSHSSQSEEDIGVTRSVMSTLSQLRSLESAVQSESDSSQPQEVLVSLVLQLQRNSSNSPELKIASQAPLVHQRHLRTSLKLLLMLSKTHMDSLPQISGQRLTSSHHHSLPTPST